MLKKKYFKANSLLTYIQGGVEKFMSTGHLVELRKWVKPRTIQHLLTVCICLYMD